MVEHVVKKPVENDGSGSLLTHNKERLTQLLRASVVEDRFLRASLLADLGEGKRPDVGGVAAYYKGNFEAALKLFEESLDKNPFSADIWTDYGKTLEKLGRRDDALLAYENALILDPLHPDALLEKGLKLQENNKEDEHAKMLVKEAVRSQKERQVQRAEGRLLALHNYIRQEGD